MVSCLVLTHVVSLVVLESMAIPCGHQCHFRPLCVISGLDEPDVQRKRCPEGEDHRRRYRDAKRSLREDFVHEVYGTHVSVSAGWKGRASRSRGGCWSNMLATCPQSTSTMSPTGVISSPRGQQRTFWTALGPLIGGVLFSHEEVRSMFSQEMMILSLFADCYHHAASLMSQAQGSSPCFRCSSTIPPTRLATLCLCCWVSWVVVSAPSHVGATLSSTGAGIRKTPTRNVFLIILFTSIPSYPMLWTQTCHPRQFAFSAKTGNVEAPDLAKMRTLCTGTEPSFEGMLCVSSHALVSSDSSK